MHKSAERILITAAILAACLYAVLNFWPEQKPAVEPPTSVETDEQDETEPRLDSKKIEAAAILQLIKLASAQVSFHALKKRFGTIDEMVGARLVNAMFSDGAIIDGYQYTVKPSGDGFAAYADPVPRPGRHFFIDETLDLRYDDNGRASRTSPYLSYSKNENPPASENLAAPAQPSPGAPKP